MSNILPGSEISADYQDWWDKSPSTQVSAAYVRHDQRNETFQHSNFATKYEKHLNDNLANYRDPEAQIGPSEGFDGVVASRKDVGLKRGRRFWCEAVIWTLIVLALMSVGGTLLGMGVRRQNAEEEARSVASAASFSTMTITATTTVQKTEFIVSEPTTTQTSSTPKPFFTTTNVKSSSFSPTTNNQDTPTSVSITTFRTTTPTASPVSRPSITSVDTLTSTAARISTQASSTFSDVTESPMSTSTSTAQATRTGPHGLISFCSVLGMACTQKMKRDLADVPDDLAALAILESALATFLSTLSTSSTVTTSSASSSSSDGGFTSIATWTSDASTTPSSQNTSPMITVLPMHAPRLGFCAVRGMACMRRR